jgi:hypothetical protein
MAIFVRAESGQARSLTGYSKGAPVVTSCIDGKQIDYTRARPGENEGTKAKQGLLASTGE